MIVVSNTTPLIGLASIGRFDLLHVIFGEITIAQAVYDEAVVAGRKEGGAKREVSGATWVGILSTIRPEIERLRHQGFSVSQAVTDAVLAAAGE